MNTCMCQLCKGKQCHYSAYYHREEGFDYEHRNTVMRLHDRIAKLERGLDKCDCVYCDSMNERKQMKEKTTSTNPERKEKLELYKTAVNDARYIFNTYKDNHPAEAWETLRKILFNKSLK